MKGKGVRRKNGVPKQLVLRGIEAGGSRHLPCSVEGAAGKPAQMPFSESSANAGHE